MRLVGKALTVRLGGIQTTVLPPRECCDDPYAEGVVQSGTLANYSYCWSAVRVPRLHAAERGSSERGECDVAH